MGYYMRFLIDDEKKINLDIIEAALKRTDSGCRIESKDTENERANLMLGAELYGQLEINRRGSEMTDEELEEFLEELEDEESDEAERVRRLLRDCRCIVAVQLLWQGRDTDETLDRLDPLWKWLWRDYRGLLQADGEGFYDANGQVL